MDKIGDMGVPWGVLSSKLMSSEMKLLKWNWTVLLLRKDEIHLHISGGKLRA
jgi:hypothetical protein